MLIRFHREALALSADDLARDASVKPVAIKAVESGQGCPLPGRSSASRSPWNSASLSLKRGASPKAVQERLGHSSIDVMGDTYSHVLPGLDRDAADRLGGIL